MLWACALILLGCAAAAALSNGLLALSGLVLSALLTLSRT